MVSKLPARGVGRHLDGWYSLLDDGDTVARKVPCTKTNYNLICQYKIGEKGSDIQQRSLTPPFSFRSQPGILAHSNSFSTTLCDAIPPKKPHSPRLIGGSARLVMTKATWPHQSLCLGTAFPLRTDHLGTAPGPVNARQSPCGNLLRVAAVGTRSAWIIHQNVTVNMI